MEGVIGIIDTFSVVFPTAKLAYAGPNDAHFAGCLRVLGVFGRSHMPSAATFGRLKSMK